MTTANPLIEDQVATSMRSVRQRHLLLTFAMAVSLAGCRGPLILSEYGALYGALGPQVPYRRPGPHAGVDFGGNFGDPVIAAANGEVSRLISAPESCGTGVVIRHREFERHTVYCHLEELLVGPFQQVKRGEPIGRMGDSGNARDCRRVRPCPHVHLELTASETGHVAVSGVTFDPMASSAGCFDSMKTYPTDRLVLTYPVRCKN